MTRSGSPMTRRKDRSILILQLTSAIDGEAARLAKGRSSSGLSGWARICGMFSRKSSRWRKASWSMTKTEMLRPDSSPLPSTSLRGHRRPCAWKIGPSIPRRLVRQSEATARNCRIQIHLQHSRSNDLQASGVSISRPFPSLTPHYTSPRHHL